jgi:hypothetical protein
MPVDEADHPALRMARSLGDGRRHAGVRGAGSLEAPSGRLVVCDPLTGGRDLRPLARSVAPGSYPVELVSSRGQELVFARLVLRRGPVAAWEPALVEGEAAEPGELPGYGVDSGTGCFADVDAWRAFCVETADQDRHDLLADALERNGGAFADHAVPGSPANVIVYSSEGDGVLPSCWGLAATGDPLCLVTLVGQPDEDELEALVSPGQPRSLAKELERFFRTATGSQRQNLAQLEAWVPRIAAAPVPERAKLARLIRKWIDNASLAAARDELLRRCGAG